MNKTKLLILLTVFIDVIGMGIVIPILPFYVEGFNSSPLLITTLFAVYALCSFLSAPVIGALSDKFGRRPMLIMSIASTALGWIIFAVAPNILFLFLGRIVDGLAAGNFPIAQAYLSDVSKDSEERSHNLGLIGAIFGIAFIFGPFLGGTLSAVSRSFPFWFVGGLAAVNTVMAIFFLPETHTERHTEEVSINPFTPIKRALTDKQLFNNYSAWFLFGLAISSFQSVFALFLSSAFGFKEFSVGLLFAATGVIIALNQAVILKRFWLRHFKEPALELMALIGFSAALMLMSLQNLFLFLVALIATTLAQSVLRVVMISQIVGKSSPARRGETMGITASITSLSMAIAPPIAGYLFGKFISAPFLLGAIFMGFAFYFLYKQRKALRNAELSEDVEIISEI